MASRKPTILIKDGHIVDPANGIDGVADLLVQGGRVAEVGKIGPRDGVEVFPADGLVVTPGLIDLHVHLRVPGFESKETVATGTAAAAAGGFTTICCMPNTRPPLDSVEVLRELKATIANEARVRVHPIATISEGRDGESPVDYDALAEAGAIGFSDDGDTCRSSAVMRTALEATRRLGRPIMVHCEDKALADGAMHDGDVSRRLRFSGIPAEAEEIIIARDLLLARLTGGWLHVLHVSTGYGADLVRRAKADGIRLTAEVMPHHLVMSDEWVAGDRTLLNTNEPAGARTEPGDPNTKVNPPLRTAGDTRQLLGALQDGTFDVVATDHAPHAEPEKVGTTFERAAMGMSGSEVALPIMLALVRAGHLTLTDLVEKMSVTPARLLNVPLGTLAPGSIADLTVFDPYERWVVAPERLLTRSANTPLLGMTMQGKVQLTLVDGQEQFRA